MIDYEKRYNDLVNDLKELWNCHTNDSQLLGELAEICPELAESEDERIRKEIISALKFANDGGIYDKHIAYLEKQKYDRMKPIYDARESFESALEKAWKDYNDSGARTVDGCEDDYVECAHAKGFREGYLFGLEKHKESLHISETCKENADSFTDACEDVIVAIEKYLDWLTGYPDYAPKGKYSIRDMLYCLSILEKQKEQKQEWSEEDEDMITTILGDLEWGRRNTTVDKDIRLYDEKISWLKSLRPQPKQEWDTYDKAAVTCIACCLDGQFVTEAARKQALEWFNKHRRDFLNSPSWKPSEEQMDALRVTIDFMPDTFKPRCTLITLLNGLEKLI